jgi:NTP pyrophosphatase (non-canonical NTP hydrolase)
MIEETRPLQKRLVNERTTEDMSICLIEEMSELTKVLTKKLRNSNKFKIEDLEEELAHVMLMCETIKTKFNISDSDILYHKHDALIRCFKED